MVSSDLGNLKVKWQNWRRQCAVSLYEAETYTTQKQKETKNIGCCYKGKQSQQQFVYASFPSVWLLHLNRQCSQT